MAAVGTLRLTADEAGVVDLDSLQIVAGLGTYTANYPIDVSPAVVVRAITLPSGEQLVVGSPKESPPVVAAPVAMWAHTGRRSPWVHFGQIEIAEDESVEILVERLCGNPVNVVAGARFYASHDIAAQAADDE
jgi:hypothetical protein